MNHIRTPIDQMKKLSAGFYTHSKIYLFAALTGALSGLVTVAYRFAIGRAESFRAQLVQEGAAPLSILFWFALALAGGTITAFFVKKSPLIRGSGIPQVKAFLLRRVFFRWKKELPLKFVGGTLALGAGLSLGREGPSIQLGALTGSALEDILHIPDFRRYLATAGAAAGISAAFNAPLAGVLFCIEELHRSFSPVMLTVTMISSFIANIVMWLFFGIRPIFGITIVEALPLKYYFSIILSIGIITGLLGSLFNVGILRFQRLYKRIVPNESLRIVSAFIVAAAVSVVYPQITGGGNHVVSADYLSLLPLALIALMLAGKFVFTLFSYASGVPGGIFLPMLAIGAIVGGLIYSVLGKLGFHMDFLPNYILLGMTGFFVAVVRAPITGAVLITEMAGSFTHFPAFILVSIVAALTASIFKTKPIYDSLLAQIPPMHPEQVEHAAITLHIPFMEGSRIHTVGDLRERMPADSILVCIMRGEERLYPYLSMEIIPGDEALIEVDQRVAHVFKEDLLKLGAQAEE